MAKNFLANLLINLSKKACALTHCISDVRLVEALGSKMCVRPLQAYILPFGRPRLHPEGDRTIPRGTCHECITLRASDWGLRTQHELGDHTSNCFVTLTYDDDHLPDLLDRKRHFQLFLKKLRKRLKKNSLFSEP